MTVNEESTLDTNTISEVLINQRGDIPKIRRYLSHTIHTINSLKYVIDDGFAPEEAFEILDEDLPNGPSVSDKNAFIDDIVHQISYFNSIKKNSSMKVQLLVVNTNKCRLFHEDFYRQRLLCTYMGPGTEWLDHNNVNRNALGKGCNDKIVKNMSLINRANTFDVILLKGANYSEDTQGIVHRSPPIEHERSIRVLLKIDE
ncbi:MAG: DUF1826 domain-containing protein [Myxococcota bacterium]|nr:DUF1826 domain-containing protein [Myxococcota bacterium]